MVAQSQGLVVSHFDTKTGKPLDISETFNNTVAQYLFPDTTFSLGTVYDKTTPEELQRFSDKSLQFANGTKFYFADTPVRDQLFPTASDGAAYGSLPLTPCLNFTEVPNVRVLVINDETGENGIELDLEEAKKLVGDCWCRISPLLHEQVGGQENTPFQFRMGIRPQKNSPVARIAKGTFCPTDLSALGEGYDLVLATSAFKGRKGVDSRAIAPGTHTLTLGLGLKSHAYYGTHSLGPQVLVNFPQGVAVDILPKQQQALEKLEILAQDQLALVEDYLQTTQQRYQYRLLGELEIDPTASSDDLDALMELVEQSNSQAIYQLLKQDNHRQLLEHPKVVAALNDHLQTRYRELATGRFVKFKGALLQPHADLKENEFCDPTLPNGEKVIVTRSPLVNSNGVITLINRHISEVAHLQGVAWMNPKTAATYLQGDFDGDRVAYALAREYPTLAAEVEAKHQVDQRYADVVKQAKIPYTGSFEEIALSAKNNQIGLIAYQVMGAIALEQEISALPEPEKQPYLQQFSDYFASLWRQDKKTGERRLSSSLEGYEAFVTELSALAQSQGSTEQKLEFVRQMLHDTVSELGSELQVAVDGPKSALRPNPDVLNACQALTRYREVGWLKDYKAPETYRDRPLSSTNYSPVDLLVRPVNQIWQDYSLSPRQSHQFQGLFADVPCTPQDLEWAETVKTEYNRLNARAFRLKEEYAEAPGPRLILTTPKGHQLTVIHTLDSNHPQTYTLDSMDIGIRRNEGKRASHPELKYMVTARVSGEVNARGQPLYKRIGYLSTTSALERGSAINTLIAHSDNHQADLKTRQVEVSPGVTPNQIQAAFTQVRTFAQDTYTQIPPEQKLSKAAALWEVTHRRQNKLKNEQGEMKEEQAQRYNKANAAFALFSDEIATQLNQLQFKQFKVAGIATPANEYGSPPLGHSIPFLIDLETKPYHPDYGSRSICVEGQVLGYLGEDEAQLPIGATGRATFSGELAKTLTATLSDGQSFKVGLLKNYAYADRPFSDTAAELEVTFITPKGRHKPVPALRYQGQLLGEVRDKSAIALLQSQGLHRSGTQFSATLHRQIYGSVAIANVDPTTIEYGEVFLTEKALLPKQLGTLKLRDTLWAIEGEREKPSLRFAVDHRQLKALETYFPQNQVPYTLATEGGDVGQEYGLGYSVVRVERDALSQSLESALSQKFGSPMTADDYQQRLAQIEASQNTFKTSQEPPAVQATASLPIVGQPIAMNYPLRLHGKPNSLPVTTTIEAMRGHGRTHTTRGYEPYKAYGFTQGDLALAVSGDSQVLFRVGRQYLITPGMVADPNYQAQWANSEKHSAHYLSELAAQYGDKLWGLKMEPLGDYRNGRVWDFQTGVDLTDRLLSSDRSSNPVAAIDAGGASQTFSDYLAIKYGKQIDSFPCQYDFFGDEEFPAHLVSYLPAFEQTYYRITGLNLEQLRELYDSETEHSFMCQECSGTRHVEPALFVKWQFEKEEQALAMARELGIPFFCSDPLVIGFPLADLEEYVQLSNEQTSDGSVLAQLRAIQGDRSALRQSVEPEASVNGHSHNPIPNDPYQLQAQRTALVAPIVKDYLTLAQTHHHQGQKYAATWDAHSQTLSLLDKHSATLKLVAQQENSQWHSQPIPLSDPTQPNLSQADVDHFQSLAPKIAEKLAQRQQQYRTIYESAKDFIQASHGQAPADIDVKIAISVLNQTNDPQKAIQVLSVSDTARDWKQSLPPHQYQQQLSAYLKQTFQAAQQLERQQQQPYAQHALDFTR